MMLVRFMHSQQVVVAENTGLPSAAGEPLHAGSLIENYCHAQPAAVRMAQSFAWSWPDRQPAVPLGMPGYSKNKQCTKKRPSESRAIDRGHRAVPGFPRSCPVAVPRSVMPCYRRAIRNASA